MRYLSMQIGALLAGVLTAGTASAAITTFSSSTLFSGAVSGLTQVTFNEAPLGPGSGSVLNYIGGTYTPTSGSCSVSVDPTAVCFSKVNGTSSSRSVQNAASPAPTAGGNRVFFAGAPSNAANNYLLAALNTSVRAFAIDVYTLYSGGQTVTVNVYESGSATPTTYTVNTAIQTFFGLTSDDPLATVRLSVAAGSTTDIQLDNFYFANALAGPPEPPPSADTPESATLGYISIGLIILLFSRKRITHLG